MNGAQPNSGEAVRAWTIPPASRIRCTAGAVTSAMRSAKTSELLVDGWPAIGVEHWSEMTERTGPGRPSRLAHADGTAMRVLVVEDEANLAQLLVMAFGLEGWEVKTAADGPEGVRVARDFRPDVVVLDVMLPGFDGLEVLRRVRADLGAVSVLFLSARDAVEDRIAGITAGAEDYVTKPFSLEEVIARLRGM